ncbi:aminopeptidase P family protein [Deinococcus detaillensis]|uniref:Aminopeptidase P family protein n=1 Tax=Deinococcus detaillensis TaxID=2592048 RepID=A0A553UP98_9DEIO|nr:Xaa-Pro peptidase family protein [Deinococcus detaillensis]TSA82047.1 aminopeptidase P family protein [Deinococcus detaillensis]
MIKGIPLDETRTRVSRFTETFPPEMMGAVLSDDQYIYYLCAFHFIPTERPIMLVITREGERILFVPRLEEEHAKQASHADRVVSYPEYPGEVHPLKLFVKLLEELGLGQGTLGIDYDGYPHVLGYQGPVLSELISNPLRRMHPELDRLIAVKSPFEIELIRESCRWGNLAHRLLQKYTRVGEIETEVSMRASQEATRIMVETLAPYHKSNSRWQEGAVAGYRGQIGRNSSVPHAVGANLVFKEGDVLVTGAASAVWGYLSELERTMIIGTPTAKQKTYFDHMIAVQDIAFESMRAGVTASSVDQAVRQYFSKHHLEPYWRHHTGHSISMRYHEGPYLDTGDHSILEAGMVFTVEPGIYDPEVGGFRHSDTVMVTQQGVEFLTYYPRDLESLTLPV